MCHKSGAAPAAVVIVIALSSLLSLRAAAALYRSREPAAPIAAASVARLSAAFLLPHRSSPTPARRNCASAAGPDCGASFVEVCPPTAAMSPNDPPGRMPTLQTGTSLAAFSASPSFAACAAPFSAYLSECSSNLPKYAAKVEEGGSETVRLVLGNEAGDADSIISSIALAYVRGGMPSEEGGGAAASVVVPVLPIPRADLALRRETVLLLDMCGVQADKLAYVDDSAIRSLLDEVNVSGGVELILTDHNRLRSSLSHLSDSVVEIVDHHEDEGAHPHVYGTLRDVAFNGATKTAAVGSACTLVAERLFEALGDDRRDAVDPPLALALLGVVLLDTMDMSPEAGKGTERDGNAIDSLLERADWTRMLVDDRYKKLFGEGRRPIRSELYDYLRSSKFDRTFWEGMLVHDCLRIDYKRFEPNGAGSDGNGDGTAVRSAPFGMSSVLLDMDSFLSKRDVAASLRRFMAEDEADVPLLAVLTMTLIDDAPHREMLLVGWPDLMEAAWEGLLRDPDAEFLEITEYTEVEESGVGQLAAVREGLGEGLEVRRFRQGNAKGSRKQVAPVLLKKMSTLSD